MEKQYDALKYMGGNEPSSANKIKLFFETVGIEEAKKLYDSDQEIQEAFEDFTFPSDEDDLNILIDELKENEDKAIKIIEAFN